MGVIYALLTLCVEKHGWFPFPKGQSCRQRHHGACSFRYPREPWVILFVYRGYMCKGMITDQHYQIFHPVTSKIPLLLPYWHTFFCIRIIFHESTFPLPLLEQHGFLINAFGATVSHTHRITVCFFHFNGQSALQSNYCGGCKQAKCQNLVKSVFAANVSGAIRM